MGTPEAPVSTPLRTFRAKLRQLRRAMASAAAATNGDTDRIGELFDLDREWLELTKGLEPKEVNE